eukprot:1659607-Alexandrium_andersonii.AAC.1
MSDAAKGEIDVVVHRFLVNYSLLARRAAARGELLWGIVPKHHYFAHFPQIANVINPRLLRTYAEESMIGRSCGIYGGSKHGPFHNTVQGTVLRKYLLAAQLSLSELT